MNYRSGTDESKLGNPPSISTRWLVIIQDANDHIIRLNTVTAPSYFAAFQAGRHSGEKMTVIRFAYDAREVLINA
jgi:hypothetical protein